MRSSVVALLTVVIGGLLAACGGGRFDELRTTRDQVVDTHAALLMPCSEAGAGDGAFVRCYYQVPGVFRNLRAAKIADLERRGLVASSHDGAAFDVQLGKVWVTMTYAPGEGWFDADAVEHPMPPDTTLLIVSVSRTANVR
jgi:hypothetical protein